MRTLTSAAALAIVAQASAALPTSPVAAQAYVGAGISVDFAPPPLPGLRPAADTRLRLSLDPRLLGLGRRRRGLLLGAGHLGSAAPRRLSVDARILGLERRRLPVPCRLLGSDVGFYGGVDYGFGYNGGGYYGGEWRGGNFFYNSSVNNVRNVHSANVYNRPVYQQHHDQPRQLQRRTAAASGPCPTGAQTGRRRANSISAVTAQQQQHVQMARAPAEPAGVVQPRRPRGRGHRRVRRPSAARASPRRRPSSATYRRRRPRSAASRTCPRRPRRLSPEPRRRRAASEPSRRTRRLSSRATAGRPGRLPSQPRLWRATPRWSERLSPQPQRG